MPSNNYEVTTFLNVDLDVNSRSNLQPLVAGLGRRILVLHAGRRGRTYSAHFELAWAPKSADAAVRGFAALIRSLPKPERRLWDRATVRDFNIGVQAATQPHYYEIRLAQETVKIVSALKARIVVTIYAAEVARVPQRRIMKNRRRTPNNSLQRTPQKTRHC